MTILQVLHCPLVHLTLREEKCASMVSFRRVMTSSAGLFFCLWSTALRYDSSCGNTIAFIFTPFNRNNCMQGFILIQIATMGENEITLKNNFNHSKVISDRCSLLKKFNNQSQNRTWQICNTLKPSGSNLVLNCKTTSKIVEVFATRIEVKTEYPKIKNFWKHTPVKTTGSLQMTFQ